jgi:hypothetical protein
MEYYVAGKINKLEMDIYTGDAYIYTDKFQK